jgi:hypothetical protein
MSVSLFYLIKCSTKGPSESAGKKLKAPTMITTVISQMIKRGVWVGKVPTEGGTCFLRTKEPAMASAGIINQYRPNNMAMLSAIL